MKRTARDPVFLKNLIKLTLPIAFQSMMLAAVAAGDAIMLGRLDQDSMTAVSLAALIQFVQNSFFAAVTGTLVILGAQYRGKGDERTLDDLFAMSLRIAGIIGVVFFLACTFIPHLLMCLFTNDPLLREIGAGYLKIAAWSYLIAGISQCCLASMKIIDHASRSAWISSGAVVINILLNAVFIFGLFGFPALGAKGAACATVAARVIELVWSLVSSYQKTFLRPRLKALLSHKRALFRDFLKCALPILGAWLLWGIGLTVYTSIMGHLGREAAAANSISAVVRDLMCCLCNGISAAGGILVGNELGKGKLDLGREYGDRLAVLSFVSGGITTALVLAVTPFVTRFMKLTDEARSYLVWMLVIMSVYIAARAVNTIVINGIFAAGGDTAFDMYSLSVVMWGVAVPLSLLGAFVFHWPVLVVLACSCLDEIVKIPWVMAHYKRYKWVKDLTRERTD